MSAVVISGSRLRCPRAQSSTSIRKASNYTDRVTEQVEGQVIEEDAEELRRWGEPEDFGGIAVYLMSSASAYHTGDTFLIDGGYALF